MMKAANTAGTLMNRKNWSIESICPPKDKNRPPPVALFRPLRDVLLRRQNPIGNGGSTDREQRQNRNHRQKFHGRNVASDCGETRQNLVRFRDDPPERSWHSPGFPRAPRRRSQEVASYGVTGLTVGEVFGPGRAGSIDDFGLVGRTAAPAARAASPVVAYIAT